MTITVEATFENGVLRPLQPLPFAEHEKVTILIQPNRSVAQDSYGIIGWSGDADTFDRILKESEADLLERE